MEYLEEGGEEWREEFLPLYEGTIKMQGQELNAAMGMQWDITNVFATEAYEAVTMQFAQPIMDTTKSDIQQIVSHAIAEGESIPATRGALQSLFQTYIDGIAIPEQYEGWFAERLPRYRSELIARTETHKAANFGAQELYKGWGTEVHEWLATGDDRTRQSHLDASGQVKPIDEPFDVGGAKLLYPGDPSGPIEEIANCRCTVLPVI